MIRRLVSVTALLAALLASAAVGTPAAVAGTNIKVTVFTDVVNATDGECSLREAVVAANTNTASGAVGSECEAGVSSSADLITFAGGGTITLGGTQLPVISEALDINGGLVVSIDGANASRIFEIDGATVKLEFIAVLRGSSTIGGAIFAHSGSDVTLESVSVSSSTATGDGGGVAIADSAFVIDNSLIETSQGSSGGLAILNPSSSGSITDTSITGNTGTATFSAGGISNDGTTVITASQISNNTASGSQAAGGISTTGSLTVINSEISDNSGPLGLGGVTGRFGPQVIIVGTSMNDNTGQVYGAISGDMDLSLVGSTLDANTGSGGAVGNTPTMSIINSTLSGGNTAIRLNGSDQAVVLFSTITDNQVGIFLAGSSSLSAGANIIAGNSAADVTSTAFSGVFSSEGYNVVGQTTGTTPPSFNAINDIEDVPDPLIGALADNGGPVLTHALLNFSPAIDRVTGIVSNDQVVDAIGTSRPQGGAKDAGAVEAVGLTAAICNGQLATINLNMAGVFISGTALADVVFGTPASDNILAGAGDDVICGGSGGDFIRGGPGADSIFGDDGNDTIRGGGGGDDIEGGEGNDDIFAQGGTDIVDGGPGDDSIDGQGAADALSGGSGADTISGQNGGDTISGGADDDVLKGQTGPDEFDGGADDDDMFGGDGADTFYGGTGFDKCAGNTGPDSAQTSSCEQTPGVESFF